MTESGFREHRAGCPTEPELRKVRGCDEDAPVPLFRLGAIEYRRCPISTIRPEVWEFLSYYHQYEKGFLPLPGGVADQAGTFIQAASYLTGEINRMIEAKRKSE